MAIIITDQRNFQEKDYFLPSKLAITQDTYNQKNKRRSSVTAAALRMYTPAAYPTHDLWCMDSSKLGVSAAAVP